MNERLHGRHVDEDHSADFRIGWLRRTTATRQEQTQHDPTNQAALSHEMCEHDRSLFVNDHVGVIGQGKMQKRTFRVPRALTSVVKFILQSWIGEVSIADVTELVLFHQCCLSGGKKIGPRNIHSIMPCS